MRNEDLFTYETTFSRVPFQTEFMRENGDVWYKDAPDSASKVNHPGSGNFRDFERSEKVWLDPIDVGR